MQQLQSVCDWETTMRAASCSNGRCKRNPLTPSARRRQVNAGVMRLGMDDLRSACETFRSSSGDSEANHFSPTGVSFHKQLASSGGGCPVASHPEVVADCTERSQKTLSVLC